MWFIYALAACSWSNVAVTGLAFCHSCSALQHTALWHPALFNQFRNVLQNIKHTVNTHLWDNPVFPAGSLCFSHALGPGSDIPWTVISVTLEHKLPLALLAGQQSSKCHPICYPVQDLKQEHRADHSRRRLEAHTQCCPGLHKNTTARLLAQIFPACHTHSEHKPSLSPHWWIYDASEAWHTFLLLTPLAQPRLSRKKEVILPLCSTLMRPHLQSCIHIWGSHQNKDLQKWGQWRAKKMTRGFEHLSCEDNLRDVELCNLEKRSPGLLVRPPRT